MHLSSAAGNARQSAFFSEKETHRGRDRSEGQRQAMTAGRARRSEEGRFRTFAIPVATGRAPGPPPVQALQRTARRVKSTRVNALAGSTQTTPPRTPPHTSVRTRHGSLENSQGNLALQADQQVQKELFAGSFEVPCLVRTLGLRRCSRWRGLG